VAGLRDEVERELDVIDYQRTIDRLSRQVTQLKARSERALDAARQGAYDAVSSLPRHPIPAPARDRRRSGTPEAALWHMTDWQGAKVTPSYDSEVMHERVRRFITKARALTELQRADHPVRDGILVMGGDMIEGLFNFPTQAHEIDKTLFDQWTTVSWLIAEVVEAMLTTYERVTVVSEWGNHGRIGSKRDAVPRNDNIDRMCYEFARQVVIRDSGKRLTWDDCGEDIQRIEWEGYRALAIHGDEVGRNGFASPSTIVQHVNRWRSGAYPWDFRDVYMGHYHTHAEWAMANGVGAVYQTGSTESDNRYAGVTLAASARPSQRLHFIHPEGYVTAQYKVWVS
jgi:hypothetical protein